MKNGVGTQFIDKLILYTSYLGFQTGQTLNMNLNSTVLCESFMPNTVFNPVESKYGLKILATFPNIIALFVNICLDEACHQLSKVNWILTY